MLTKELQYKKIGSVFFLSVLFISCQALVTACGGGGAPKQAASTVQKLEHPVLSDSKEGRDDPIASSLATKFAGFTKKTPDGFWYADTKATTAPTKSFGVFSKTSNLLSLFLIFDDNTAVDMLPNFVAKPPYTDVMKLLPAQYDTSGEETLKSGDKFKWILSRYPIPTKSKKQEYFRVLVGGFPSFIEGKSILVMARSFDQSQAFNHSRLLFIIDTLAKKAKPKKEEVVAKKEEPKKNLSSEEDIEKFLEGAENIISENLSVPEKIEKINSKFKKKKNKDRYWPETHLLVGINEEGKLRTLADKTEVPTDENKMVVKALIDAVQAVGQFENPPVVDSSTFEFKVFMKGSKAVAKKVVEE